MPCSGSTASPAVVPLCRFSAHNGSIFWHPYIKTCSSPRTPARPEKEGSIVASSSPTQISQSLHPNSLIFGGLKEKHRIYNFTKPFFISPLIHLRDSSLGFPLGKPRHLVVPNLAATFVWQIVGAWEPPTLLWKYPPLTGTSGLVAGYIRCWSGYIRYLARIYPVAISCATGRFPGGV